MTVKIEFEPVCKLDVREWDELVQKHYGKPYDFQQQDGCKERQIVELEVPDPNAEDFDFQEELTSTALAGIEGVSFDQWENTDSSETFGEANPWYVEILWDRNFYPHVSMIVNDLHSKGILPEGKYMIDIDW